MCYPFTYHYYNAREEGLTEIELFEAIPDKADDFFWCRHYSNIGLTQDKLCGKNCAGYAPRNGKTGICSHKTHCYIAGEKIKFAII